MLKKTFLKTAAALGCIVLSTFLYVRIVGPPRTPLALLGALSFAAFAAIGAFLMLAAPGDRPATGTGALAMLIASLGASIIVVTLAASAFGMNQAFLYAGLAPVAALTAAALLAVRERGS